MCGEYVSVIMDDKYTPSYRDFIDVSTSNNE